MKIHWVNWNFNQLNQSDGGLGFKNLHLFNLALLAKNSWKLFTKPNTPCSQMFREKYYKGSSPGNAKKQQSSSSYVWKGLKEGASILNNDITWEARSGNFIDIWYDKWIPSLGNNTLLNIHQSQSSTRGQIQGHELLGNFITKDGSWDCLKLQQCIPQQFLPFILNIPLQNGQNESDVCLWRGKQPTTKAIYNLLFEKNDLQISKPSTANCLPNSLWSKFWKLPVPFKVKSFLWKLFLNRLPTIDNIRQRSNLTLFSKCGFCNQHEETLHHLFLDCFKIKRSWWHFTALPTMHSNLNFLTFLCSWLVKPWKRSYINKSSIVFICSNLWSIWLHRNDIHFN